MGIKWRKWPEEKPSQEEVVMFRFGGDHGTLTPGFYNGDIIDSLPIYFGEPRVELPFLAEVRFPMLTEKMTGEWIYESDLLATIPKDLTGE